MEQLVQFISASISDMNNGNNSSGSNSLEISRRAKSPKNTMDDSSVHEILRPKLEDNSSSSSSDVVQQSQVSSSRSPSVLANDIIGPLLLEALDGFLFMVDSMGKIQFISENVTQYLKYTQDDLVGNSIYNLVHSEDHEFFTKSLTLLSVDSTAKSRTFTCRMLIKPPGEERHQSYDKMQITAILQPHPCDTKTDRANRYLLACIARRIGHMEKPSTALGIDQFTTKQDLQGIILDISGISPGSHTYMETVGQNIQDYCHPNDKPQMHKHHREVLNNGSNTSGVYRFRLQDRHVFVQTKSKLFKSPLNGRPEFIMSTHSIVRECDADSELKDTASASLMKAIIGQSTSKNRLLQSSFSSDSHDSSSRLLHHLSKSSKQMSSSGLDLNELFFDSGICLDLVNDADDLAFSDIPDLPPNSGSWSNLLGGNLNSGLENSLSESLSDTLVNDLWSSPQSDNRGLQYGGHFNFRRSKKERPKKKKVPTATLR